MARVRAKVSVFGLNANKRKILGAVDNQGKDTMKSVIADLTRLSSEIAPLDKGDLEQSWDNSVAKRSHGYKGRVKYEAWNKHPNRSYDFNYAIWIHEETYNLGVKSKAKGGSSGLSGKFYPVGNRYLVRPLEGEATHYRDLFEEEIKDKLRKMD